MKSLGTFPFGQPIHPVLQKDRSSKKVFVLGVYASAVHAKWLDPDGKIKIRALAVASEPEIFWRGQGVDKIIAGIDVPAEAGRLVPADAKLNGPSGVALDERFLAPLGLTRKDAWLCDLVPHSCRNERQQAAVKDRYMPLVRRRLAPKPDWPAVPKVLADAKRVREIEDELVASKAGVLITLGDQPLRWFARHYGAKARLATYGTERTEYGRLHPIEVRGREIMLLPLVHPRQAAALGAHSERWRALHEVWARGRAKKVLQG